MGGFLPAESKPDQNFFTHPFSRITGPTYSTCIEARPAPRSAIFCITTRRREALWRAPLSTGTNSSLPPVLSARAGGCNSMLNWAKAYLPCVRSLVAHHRIDRCRQGVATPTNVAMRRDQPRIVQRLIHREVGPTRLTGN